MCELTEDFCELTQGFCMLTVVHSQPLTYIGFYVPQARVGHLREWGEGGRGGGCLSRLWWPELNSRSHPPEAP